MNTDVITIVAVAVALVAGFGLSTWRAALKERERLEAEEARQKAIRDEIQIVTVPTAAEGKRMRMGAMPFLPEYDPGDMSVTHAFLPAFSKSEDGVHVSVRGGPVTGEVMPICARSAVIALENYFLATRQALKMEKLEGEVFGPKLSDEPPSSSVALGTVIGFAFFTFEKQFYFRLCSETPGLMVTYGPVTLGDAEEISRRLDAVVKEIGPEAIEAGIVKIDLGKPKPRKVVVKGDGDPGFGLKA